MPVEQNRFYFRQEGIMTVDVRPPRLHHADLRIGEVMDGTQQEVLGGRKVRVENGDEIAFRRLQSFRQRTRLKSLAIGAMVIADGISEGCIPLNQGRAYLGRLVGGIIEHLNVELVAGIIDL